MSESTDYKLFSILRWPICLSTLNFIWPIGQVNNQIFQQKLQQQQQQIAEHIRQTPIENFRSDYLFSVSFFYQIFTFERSVLSHSISIFEIGSSIYLNYYAQITAQCAEHTNLNYLSSYLFKCIIDYIDKYYVDTYVLLFSSYFTLSTC